jgi:hypothetical protein
MQTVGDLIAALSEFDSDLPILVAHQPSWPIQETIDAVRTVKKDCEYCGGRDGHYPDCENKQWYSEGDTVYVVLGGQPEHPYAPREVFEEQ